MAEEQDEDIIPHTGKIFAEEPEKAPEPAPVEKKPEEKAPEAPPSIQPQKEELPVQPEDFWKSLHVQAVIDIGPLDPPELIGKKETYTGRIAFRDLPAIAGTFEFDVDRVDPALVDGNPKVPNVSLTVHPQGILKTIGRAADYFLTKGFSAVGRGGISWFIDDSSFVGIFTNLFEAVKAKSNNLYWIHPPHKAYVVDFSDVKESADFGSCSSTIIKKFQDEDSLIKREGDKTLKSHADKKKHVVDNSGRVKMTSFVFNMPKDRFEVTHVLGVPIMATTMKLEEFPQDLQEYIKKNPKGSDNIVYSYTYDGKDTVQLENRAMTDTHIIQNLYKIYKEQGVGDHPEDIYGDLAKQFGVPSQTIEDYLGRWVGHLTDKVKGTVQKILHMKPVQWMNMSPEEIEKRKAQQSWEKSQGIKKVADYGDPWPGPSLEEIGHLVGVPQAQWASELAGKLASDFGYISYPKMVGGPQGGMLEKLSTLPLSPAQREKAEKFRPEAIKMLKALVSNVYESDLAGEGEAAGFLLEPEQMAEEVGMMAEDALLDVAERLPSTVSDEDFRDALRDRMNEKAKMLFQHKNVALPSEQSSVEDIYHGRPISLEQYEAPIIEKTAHCGPCSPLKAETIKRLKAFNVDKDQIASLEKVQDDLDLNKFIAQLDPILAKLPNPESDKVRELMQIAVTLRDIAGRIDDGEFIATKKEAALTGAVQIKSDEDIPEQIRGRMGKIVDHRVDWEYMGDHMAPINLYLVEMAIPSHKHNKTLTAWMFEDDFEGAGSSN